MNRIALIPRNPDFWMIRILISESRISENGSAASSLQWTLICTILQFDFHNSSTQEFHYSILLGVTKYHCLNDHRISAHKNAAYSQTYYEERTVNIVGRKIVICISPTCRSVRLTGMLCKCHLQEVLQFEVLLPTWQTLYFVK